MHDWNESAKVKMWLGKLIYNSDAGKIKKIRSNKRNYMYSGS